MARSRKVQEVIDQALSLDQAVANVGLGVDMVEVERMERILSRTPSFAQKVFSSQERAYCDSRPYPAIHYAARFAAKEAVVKALGLGFSSGISVRDVEVVREEGGRPSIVLTGRARDVAEALRVTDIPVSLSHTKTDAIACAMALTQDAARTRTVQMTLEQELAQQFKQARAMLDDLGSAEDVSHADQAL